MRFFLCTVCELNKKSTKG